MQEKSHLILGQSQREAYRLLSLAGRTLYISGCRKNGYDLADYLGKLWAGHSTCRNYKCKNAVAKCMNNRENDKSFPKSTEGMHA